MTISQEEFYRRCEAFVRRMMEHEPVLATEMGEHRHDHRLADYSRPALEGWKRELAEALAEFQGFDTSSFDLQARLDQVLMVQFVKSLQRSLERIRPHFRDPGLYLRECTDGAFLLLVREFAPLEERLESLLSRLRAVPEVLAQGKANVEPESVPLVWAQVALESAQRGLSFFTSIVPSAARGVPGLAPQVERASRRAAEAVEDYISFLREEVIPRAKGDFAVGRELFEEMLRQDHMLDISTEELLETGWRLFEETKAEMERVAGEIDPHKSAREILEEAKADHPSAGELLDVYRREMERVRRFVVERDIAAIPEGESLKVEPTPPFMWPFLPYAAYISPGPFERVQQGVFLVTPVDPDAPPEEREEKLRGHSYAKLPVTALHEAYPGHHLQLTYANTLPTLPPKLGSMLSSLFVEGWAFYCEELMEKLGYIAQPIQRLGRLSDQLWRAGRIILDVGLHTKGMGVEEAVDFLVREVGLERSNALAEVRWYTQAPTYPMSYLMGKLEILKLVEEYKRRHPQAPLREIHKAILSCGSIPPKLMRKRLFGDSDPGLETPG